MMADHDHDRQAVAWSLTSLSESYISSTLVPAVSLFGCVVCGAGYVVLCCGLKLVTRSGLLGGDLLLIRTRPHLCQA